MSGDTNEGVGKNSSNQTSSPFENRHGHIEQFRGDMRVLYRVIRDDQTPIYVPLLMIGVVGYALSPIDAIPDLIPIGGIVDEAVVFYMARAFVYRVVPERHIEQHASDVADSGSSPFGMKKAYAAVAIIQLVFIGVLLVVIGRGLFSIT